MGVLASKVDKEDAMPLDEIQRGMGLNSIMDELGEQFKLKVMSCSATEDTNLEEALDWIIPQLGQQKNEVRRRLIWNPRKLFRASTMGDSLSSAVPAPSVR